MLTNEKAEMLLKMPKWVVGKENGRDAALLSHCAVSLAPGQPSGPLNDLPLASKDGGQGFRLVVDRKRELKLTLHHLTSPGDGLLRVDYGGGGHKNPPHIPPENLGKVPKRLRAHIGRRISHGVAHIHYYVEGFPNLDWALPLSEDDFPVKVISGEDSVILGAVRAFGRLIALETQMHPAAPR